MRRWGFIIVLPGAAWVASVALWGEGKAWVACGGMDIHPLL